MRIAVVGGGPAGLYFALLMKRDWPELTVDVFERNQADDTFGFGVVFSDQTLDTFKAADAQSYAAIRDNFAYWDDIEIHFKDTVHRVPGNGFCGCSRRSLLMLVQARARELGVGLHFGVARPQNRTSDYITEVKDTGHAYRSPTGRGYNSKAELDFHVDSSDVVLLSCYNQAPVGGMSMCASAATAYAIVQAERPDYAAALATDYAFSRNGEQAADERPWYAAPICTVGDGRVFRLAGAVAHDRRVTAAAGHLHRIQRLAQRANLVDLDQDAVGHPLVDPLLEPLCAGHKQVVADELHLVAQLLRQLLPAVPVVLRQPVLDGADRPAAG